MKFYVCKHCGNIISYLKESGVKVVCCGEKMTELIPNSTEAATEKHIPVIAVNGNHVKVTVSTTLHPMIEAHYIEWIALETETGNQRKVLKPGDAPVAEFEIVEGDKVVAAYAYCNLHGLWKSE
ncbi:MAG: desulfoferrodoxin [Bacillales bacterium]|nr:desulfoferrodoxin [Bacillales bacterium]